MALPQRIYDEENEAEKLSAYERAQRSWGMAPTSDETNEGDEAAAEESTALDKARDRWGEADVHEGGDAGELGEDGKTNKSGDDSVDTPGDGDTTIPYRKEKASFRSRYVTRRNGVIVGLTALVGGGGFGLVSIASGPLQLIHLSNFLSTSFFSRHDNSSDASVRRIYNTITGQGEKNRLSPLASALATRNLDKLKELGIEANFETADGKGRRKIQSLSIDPSTVHGQNLLGRALAEGVDVPSPVNGRVTIDLRGTRGGEVGRALVDQMVEISGKKGVTGVVAKRRLRKLFRVDFHPLSIARRKGESLVDYHKRRRSERAQEVKEGVSTSDLDAPANEPDAEGNTEPVDEDVSADGADADAAVDDIKNTSDPVEKKSKLKSLKGNKFLKAGATAAAVVSITCAVKDVGDDIPNYKMLNVIQPLIRLSVQYVAAGSQVQAMQDVNMAELGSIAPALYDEETGTSWAAAAPLVAASGRTGGTDLDPAVKSQITGAYNGDKPLLFDIIDSIPFVSQACRANSWLGNIPGIREISDLGSSAISKLSTLTTGKSLEEWMQDLVAVLSGEAIDTLAEGGLLGNLLSYGSLLASNAIEIVGGGTELTLDEVVEWNNYNQEVRLAERQQQSWSERTLSLESPDSLASTVMFRVATSANMGSFTNWARTGPASIFSGVTSGLFGVFNRSASAATVNGYNFNIPQYGVPLHLLENERYFNVYENIDRLEENDFAKLKEANDKWGFCFGNPLDDQGNIIDKEVTGDTYARLEECREFRALQAYQDYQIYINDNVTIKSFACYEGIDNASCSEVGFVNAASTGASSPTTIIEGDTTHIPCAAGEDLGVADGYRQGELIKIRLCRIAGTRVNSQISGNYQRMYDAAIASGLSTFSGGEGFRTMEDQRGVFKRWCPDKDFTEQCNGAARPGYSNHQMGLAFDIYCDGETIPQLYEDAKDEPCFIWMLQNAGIYGLMEFGGGTSTARARAGYEAWHWSVDGR